MFWLDNISFLKKFLAVSTVLISLISFSGCTEASSQVHPIAQTELLFESVISEIDSVNYTEWQCFLAKAKVSVLSFDIQYATVHQLIDTEAFHHYSGQFLLLKPKLDFWQTISIIHLTSEDDMHVFLG